MSQYNPFSLAGKTILVTGASSGIGRGVAVACSKMGATLVLHGRNKQNLETTLASLEGEGHQIVIADLTERDTVTKVMDTIPMLDGVVHCAGIGQRALCVQLTDQDVSSVMDANFKGPILLQQTLLEKKKINKGASIVFMASMASVSPSFGHAVYSASKGAIVSYANCLSLELAPKKIRVNCISPAMVWTDLILNEGLEEEQLKEDEKKYPLKRYGQPKDIAHLAIYLLSDASEWMTGSNIKISGGAY
jgi:NAD(P)-dependent dehydrogenase (short-subunit alcohol dehydrogenase family)